MTNEVEHLRLSTGLPADIAASEAPVVVMQADGSILYVSRPYCDLVGKTRAELLGRRADRVDIASSSERTRWIINRASEVGTAFSYRRLYDTPDGDRLVDVSVHRVAEDLLVTTMAYVTEEDAVSDEHQLLESFLDAVPLGVVVYDRALRLVRVNRIVEELGRVRPEHLGQRVTDAFPDVDPAVVSAIEEVLASGEEIVNLALACSDGHSLLLNFFPIPGAHGAVDQVGCLFSDVTEFAQAHETIQAQEAAIRDLSPPILELEEGVLVAPLVGAMDPGRARELTERLLHAITRTRARVVVFDITGVPVIDSDVSHELLNAAAVARLMGTRVVMSGISTEHAAAITGLGLRTGDIETVTTLADAVAVARSLPPLPV